MTLSQRTVRYYSTFNTEAMAISFACLFLFIGTANGFLPGASDIARTVLEQVQDHLSGASRSMEGRQYGGYGGCTDSFSVFGFLAFILALLDLILDLQANMGGTGMPRGIRSVNNDDAFTKKDSLCQENAEMLQATSACYSLLRGFLNALAAENSECANRFMCEGAEEASTAGPIGEVIANVASLNAGPWLMRVNATIVKSVVEAGQTGAKLGGCALRFSQCFGLPSAYRYPAVYRGPQLPSEVYQPLLQEIMDTARDTLL